MTRGWREGLKKMCKKFVERLSWMIRVKDCCHICLICKYFDMCKAEGVPRKEEKVK